MKVILKLLLLLSLLMSCRSKHLQIVKSEESKKEFRKSEKDSVFDTKTETKTAVFELNTLQNFEMELATEKDSTGQSKVLEFERIRSPSSEKIIVRGGSVRLRTADNSVQRSSQYSNNIKEKGIIRTNISEQKTLENKTFSKQKEVKAQGLSFGNTFAIILWVIILLIVVFLLWRLKFFRKIANVITKFKRFLNSV